jgi:2-polyprenyl-6-methoxyphenol hydroxylase-like FAD-dependent oxidoreductase
MLYVPNLEPRYDVIVVGARCAGGATAMLLAAGGLEVLALDRQPYGSDTLSTHALMRPAVTQLSRWGLLEQLISSGAPVIGTTTFHYGAEEVEVPIRPEPGIPGLLAPRRTVLDAALADAARRAGASVRHDVTVQDIAFDRHGRACGVLIWDAAGRPRRIDADHIVGADGFGSLVARRVNAPTILEGQVSVAHVFGYAVAPPLSGYHWFFARNAGGAAIPTNAGSACIVASVPTDRFDAVFRGDLAAGRLRVLKGLSPELAAHAAAAPAERLKAFRGAPGRLRRAHGPGWILVGDSGFFRDPLTSHGISDALRDAEGAATAILSGRPTALREFEEERDSVARPVLEVTDAICAFDRPMQELPELHRKFSETMKLEAAMLAARATGGGTAVTRSSRAA